MATRGAPAFYSPYGPMGQDPEEAAKGIALAGRGAYGYGKDFVGMLANALRHPVDTANSAWDAGKQIGSQLMNDPVGLGKQVVLGELEAMKGAAQDPEKLGAYAASFVDPIKLLSRGKSAATMAMAAGKKGGRGSPKPNLQRDGVPITDLLDAEKRWGNGEKIYAFHEIDEAPSLVTSLEMLNNYQPDQLLALPNKMPPAPVAQQIPDALRGVIDAQEKVAMNLPVTMSSRKGKTNVLLDRGMPPNREEMNNILNALRGSGFEGDVSATNRGVMIFNDNAKGQKALKKRTAALEAALPDSVLKNAANEGLYVPAMSAADEANQGIATTRALQAFADAPEQAALNVGESESVRNIIKQKMARDEARGGARPDIQEMRRFFAEADWPKAVKLMRKGMTPAAAVAALGYSITAMADDAPPDVPVTEEKQK